jgi:hypothetical protein
VIEKHIFLGMNLDSPAKDLQDGEHREAYNLVPVRDGVGVGARRENAYGTRSVSLPVPDDAICVGLWNYPEQNKIYGFFQSTSASDMIIEYDGFTNEAVVIMSNSILNFNIDYPVIDVFVVPEDDTYLLYFNDGLNGKRKINIAFAKTGALDAITSERALSLIKVPPLKTITSNRVTDGTLTELDPDIRRIPVQFATRYVYKDDEYSVLSPISKLAPALNYDEETNEYNAIDVTLHIDVDIEPILERVELCVREGNDQLWYVYQKFDPADFGITNGDGTRSVVFRLYMDKSGGYLSEQEADTVVESVPRLSSTMEFMEDRVFAVSTLEEFNPEDDAWDCSITFEEKTTGLEALLNQDIYFPLFYKNDSYYTWGLVFYNNEGREIAPIVKDGMSKRAPKNTPSYSAVALPDVFSYFLSSLENPLTAKPVITGKPPSWAKKYQFVRSDNLSYNTWFKAKCLIKPMYSIDSQTEEPPQDLLDSGVYLENGYWYQSVKALLDEYDASGTIPEFPEYAEIIIPDGMPIPIDEKTLVRSAFKFQHSELNGFTADDVRVDFKIERIENGRIRIKGINFLSPNQTWHATTVGQAMTGCKFASGEYPDDDEAFLHFEFLNSIKRTDNPILYKVGKVYDVVNPGLDGRSFQASHEDIPGDCYYAGYIDLENSTRKNPDGSDHRLKFGVLPERDDIGVYSVAYPVQSPFASREKAGTWVDLTENPESDTGLFQKTSYDDKGRPTVQVPNQRELRRGTQVRFSRTYIQDSLINGLSNFPEENKYAITTDRGDITKLVATNERVLVAVHSRSVTSLYINYKFINAGEGEAFLAQTDRVIAEDKKLLLGLGSTHPESVVLHDSRVYGFDSIMSEPWRRSLDGITPLAYTYGMKTYFEEKGATIRDIQSKDPNAVINIFGGYDKWLNMYILTFDKIEYTYNGSNFIVQAETIGFSEKYKKWLSFYDYRPEYYSSIMNRLVTAKDQKLWVHDDEVNRNNFYGVQYNSSITIDAKESNDVPKVFQSLALQSNDKWSMECELPNGAESILTVNNFVLKNSIFYAEMLRDRNSPSANLEPNQTPLLHGEKLIGETIKIKLTNTSGVFVYLDAIYVGYSPVAGHLLATQ